VVTEYEEIPGNARGSMLAYQRSMLRIAEQLARAEYVWERLAEGMTEVVSFSVRLPQYAGGEYLVVVRAIQDGKPVVGFHSADTLSEVLRGVLARLTNGSIKWKADKYDGK